MIDMDSEQIRSIAAEPKNVEIDRKRLNEELEKLYVGRQTLTAFNTDGFSLPPRPDFGKYRPNHYEKFPRLT